MTARTQRDCFSCEGAPTPGGTFEILAITAGEGNGWIFSEAALRDSLPLWEGAQCFIDHASRGHSIRDLAGALSDVRYDTDHNGIKASLKPFGPSAGLLREMGSQILSEGGQRVGFSADLAFSARGRQIEQILKIYSVDLVVDPARGGAFLRALNEIQPISSRKELSSMDSETSNTQAARSQLESEREAARALLDEQGRLRVEAEKARAIRAEMCAQLLETALASSNLPAPVAGRVRKQFAGQIFEPDTLRDAISDARQMLSDLTAASVVRGPGQISGMFSSEDQLQAAVDDLFGAPRAAGSEALRTHKLQGIRELYMTLTGDFDLHGGYDGSRVRLATTSDFSGLVKNALNKVVVNQWQALGRAGYDWWTRVAVVEHFNSLQSITGTLVGTVGTLPSVAEGGAYTELTVGDSPETAAFTKYGGYIPLTLELIDRDETAKLKAYPRELANAGLRKISALVAAIFSDNAGVGPTMADSGALFNATAVTTAGGHKNLRTTALSASEWDAVSQAVYAQPMLIKNSAGVYGSGPAMAVNPRYLLVPRALQLSAMKILYPTLENAANIYSENQQRGQPGDVITVPEWTDANNWAAACDPTVAPAIFIGERFGIMPEIFIAGDELSPAVFTNDEHRLKVRHFLSVWVNDFRPLHKNNVA